MPASVINVEYKHESGQRAKKEKFERNRYQASLVTMYDTRRSNFFVPTPKSTSGRKPENTRLKMLI